MLEHGNFCLVSARLSLGRYPPCYVLFYYYLIFYQISICLIPFCRAQKIKKTSYLFFYRSNDIQHTLKGVEVC